MRRQLSVCAVALALGLATSAHAQEPEGPPPGPYDRGRLSLGFGAGSQRSGGDSHIYVAGGVGYFVAAGLELGASGLYLFGANEGGLGPRVRYVFHQTPGPIKPYLGVFHTHWFVADDFDTAGVRAGVITLTGGLLIGLGVAYEAVITECSGDDCDLWYPELSFAVAL